MRTEYNPMLPWARCVKQKPLFYMLGQDPRLKYLPLVRFTFKEAKMRSFFKVKFNLTFRCSLEKDPKKDTFIFRFPFEFYFKVVDFWEVDTSELKSEVAINVSS